MDIQLDNLLFNDKAILDFVRNYFGSFESLDKHCYEKKELENTSSLNTSIILSEISQIKEGNKSEIIKSVDKNKPKKSSRAILSCTQDEIYIELRRRLQSKGIKDPDENLLIRCLIGRE